MQYFIYAFRDRVQFRMCSKLFVASVGQADTVAVSCVACCLHYQCNTAVAYVLNSDSIVRRAEENALVKRKIGSIYDVTFDVLRLILPTFIAARKYIVILLGSTQPPSFSHFVPRLLCRLVGVVND